MEIINKRFEEKCPIASLMPHPRNVNQGDAGAIHASIEANGFYGAVVVQESTGRILAGNHRWMVARQQGAESIPAIFVDVDDDAALRIMLADNRTTRLGMNDDHALAELLQELSQSPMELTGTGYNGDDLDELLTSLSGAPQIENVQPEQRSSERATVKTCPACGHEF